jgi:hypothetical protein
LFYHVFESFPLSDDISLKQRQCQIKTNLYFQRGAAGPDQKYLWLNINQGRYWWADRTFWRWCRKRRFFS